MNLLAVTGSPVLHSKSPQIFNALFGISGKKEYHYSRLIARNSDDAVRQFKSLNLNGMNVTAPFKSDIILYLDKIDYESEFIHAVNTIIKENNKLIGYNTDIAGVIETLRINKINPDRKHALILGTGGAGRAAAYAMMKAGANVSLMGRRSNEYLYNLLNAGSTFTDISEFDNYIKKSDILINTLPGNINLFNNNFHNDLIILDANYHNPSLLQLTKLNNINYISGINWLYYQALKSYKIFTGIDIPPSMNQNMIDWNYPGSKSHFIALVGFMGSGKSLIGSMLADRLKIKWLDTDNLIEAKERDSITNIFVKNGEKYFRSIERKMILDLFDNATNNEPFGLPKNIISFGGGVLIDRINAALIKNNSIVIWINASLDKCLERIKDATRPVITNKSREEINELYNYRNESYFQYSDIIINGDSEPEIIADIIIHELENLL